MLEQKGDNNNSNSNGVLGNRFPSWKYKTNSFAGTERYMAPEQLLQKSYSFSVDWFQLGITLAELLTRRHPFQGPNHYQTMKNIVDASYIPVLRVSRRMKPLSKEVVSFLDALLQRNPARRLGTVVPSTGKVDARKHPWFTDLDWDVAMQGGLNAGFVPIVSSSVDVSNFDDVFTQETAELSGERFPSDGSNGENGEGSILENGFKTSNWMNLWGLLGNENANDKKTTKNGTNGTANGMHDVITASKTKDDGDDFDDFAGFSFEEPSSAAQAIVLEELEEVVENIGEEEGGRLSLEL